MARKLARLLIILLGCAVGPLLFYSVDCILMSFDINIAEHLSSLWMILIYVASGLISGATVMIFSKRILNGLIKFIRWIEGGLTDLPVQDVIAGVVGLLVGWVIALFLNILVNNIGMPVLNFAIMLVLYIILGYLGWSIGSKRRSELVASGAQLFRRGKGKEGRESKEGKEGRESKSPGRVKLLDTSVIIDGRILDICATGFVEGTLVIPGFVLQELRHIADSSDSLKRNRGRRGLDILKRMQDELDNKVRVVEKNYNNIQEVDEKLLRMAQDMNAVVLTNDYNLNKVADVQKVRVLNINELAGAVKPVLLPGEEMEAQIIKDGKEPGQGVAYLDDGTMIVVENGRKHIGQSVSVQVTSVLQTAAGRMIFAKMKA